MKRIPATTPADHTIDFAALEADALKDMTPAARLAHEMAKRQLAAAERANELAAANDRRDVAADAPAAERVRTAGEEHEAIAAGRKSARVRLSLSFPMDRVQGFPMATVTVSALGHVAGAGEKHAGDVILTQLSGWDFGEAEKALERDCLAPVEAQVAEAMAAGQAQVAEALKAKFMGASPEGFKGRRWLELQRPVMARVLCGKPLAALLASGVARQVGDVEVSDVAIRTAIEQP